MSPNEKKAVAVPLDHSGSLPGPFARFQGTELDRARLIGFVVFAVLLMAAFIKPLLGLASHARQSSLHSHILLVPFVSAYLIYTRRELWPRHVRSSLLWALLPFLAGGAFLAAGFSWGDTVSHNDGLALFTSAFLGFLIAGAFLFFGKDWISSLAFPIFFLVFMVPMPDAMAATLERASQLASADAASMFFDLTRTPVLRDGTIFQLPNLVIEVAEECSGIRSSWVLLITSLLAANLFLTSGWTRAILLGLVIPLGIIRNGFRVWVIAVLCINYGPHMVHSIIHRRGGPLFFALSLVVLFAVLWLLRQWERRRFAKTAAASPGSVKTF